MASINKVILVGNLGRDPESRNTANGESVATISIATTDRWRDKSNGEMRENTEWHRVVFFSKLADVVTQYLRKGSQIYVEGKLRTRKWQDKETGQDRYTTEIVGDVMQMLGSRQGQGEPSESRAEPRESKARSGSQPQGQADADVGFRDMVDDIPF